MNGNTKAVVFAVILVGAALLLWGPKGIITLLPGPNPK
jgi:hypothetical protein